MNADVYGSVTRITDLANEQHDVEVRATDSWQTGDYVVARVAHRPDHDAVFENEQGRRVELMEGETLVGALGTRRATQGLVGGWRDVPEDGQMHVLTGGGVLGRVTSASTYAADPIAVTYEGHVTSEGEVRRMVDHALEGHETALSTPVILVMGTSMSAGKTMSARVITRTLIEQGHRVVACKLTGAGRARDMLSMDVAGAEAVYDFVDAGLPTTVVPESTFKNAIAPVLGRIEEHGADAVVAEVGASPLEPYNGEAAVELIDDHVAFTVLCASDPYAVVGLEDAYGHVPDLVSGIATNTSAGTDLIEKLTDSTALNLQREDAKEPLGELLRDALD